MKLITVMIVDDEKLAIDDLLTIVDWSLLGFEVVATAFNGRQALSKYKIFHPQVVFTDMRMPFMDGVELIENLRGIDKQLEIIVLSAYEDFAYAKSAIKCGISDYVIKSEINKDSFTQILVKLKNKITQKNENKQLKSSQAIRDFFFEAENSHLLKLENLLEKEYSYLIVEQNLPLNLSGNIQLQALKCPKADMEKTILNHDYGELELLANGSLPMERTLIVLDTNENSESNRNKLVRCHAKALAKELEDEMRSSFTIYYVSRGMFIDKLKSKIREQPWIFEQKFFDSKIKIVDITEISRPAKETVNRLDRTLMTKITQENDSESFFEYVDKIFKKQVEERAFESLLNISRELYSWLKLYNEDIDSSEGKERLKSEKAQKNWSDFNNIGRWTKETFLAIANDKNAKISMKYSKPIEQSIRFIQEHYRESALSLHDIAENVHLSTGYLSVLFKNETGITLKNFIVDTRIEAAKKLLAEENERVYDVSEAVGYTSSQYFGQAFYKKVGVYPNEYRKGGKN